MGNGRRDDELTLRDIAFRIMIISIAVGALFVARGTSDELGFFIAVLMVGAALGILDVKNGR